MTELDQQQHTTTTSPADAAAGVSRRVLLRGVGAATLGVATVGVLAACSSGGSGSGSSAASTPAAGGGAAGVLAKVADIPVGGSISAVDADGKAIILSQPTAGTVVGLSAICTHRGCTVAPDGATLVCPCHGSVFTSADGANVSGPASTPLPAVAVRVENGNVLPA
ncbi:Rieske (2Fe-2S) protein [Pengzhenrongella phosphoraccumulans]|jgi:cytochrome b6-f complex iron-sulfur subunit|uniref:Rieske (2Fe-2S) protein n=1 Tax=Pengzhenrongella phosphoraccumulans TaxID=3114394 RepID=UPI00388E2163